MGGCQIPHARLESSLVHSQTAPQAPGRVAIPLNGGNVMDISGRQMLCAALALFGVVAAYAKDTDSPADLQYWLANRYPQGALVDVVTSNLGNVFDCVDRIRQPALRNPNGGFRPIASPPTGPRNGNPPKLGEGEAVAQVEVISCPSGTVPMAHIELETLLRFGSLNAFFAKSPGESEAEAASGASSKRLGSTATHQYAKVDQYAANWGGDAVMNLWNPYTELDSEFSLSQLWRFRAVLGDDHAHHRMDQPQQLRRHAVHHPAALATRRQQRQLVADVWHAVGRLLPGIAVRQRRRAQ
jgi:hypothetical protein